jgi:hypothetical protein
MERETLIPTAEQSSCRLAFLGGQGVRSGNG